MDYIAELAAIAKEHGGIIETKSQHSMASQKPCSTSYAKKIKSIAL